MFGSIASAIGKGVDQAIDVGKSWLSYNQSKHQFADQMALSWEQLQFQKALLKNQMQWRVEDAKAAGLHPMAALGLSPSSFSPISAPSSSLADLGLGSSDFAGLGQNIDRAIMAGKNEKQRKEALDLQNTEVQLALDNKRLNNELLEVELADKRFRLRQQLTPAYPVVNQSPHLIEGQGDSPFMDKPIVRDGWLLDEKGRKISVIPSEDMKGRTEDVLGVEWFPFISSAYRDFQGRAIGHKVNGHWWHGPEKGYLPYPPKKAKKGASRVKVSDYYSQSYRY